MSQNTRLDSVTILSSKPYPLPQVHNSVGYHVNAHRSTSQRKFRLGVNAQTGRVQWCPGVTCCKFLIIIPVVMLPITLVLILLLRLDGMLMALRVHQHQQQQHEQLQQQQQQSYTALLDDYDLGLTGADGASNTADVVEDMVNEQLLLPLETQKEELSEEERLKRCVSFKFGLSETMDMEDRDLMKDARTSFLPPGDTTAIPRECLETLSYGAGFNKMYNTSPDDRLIAFIRKRSRRTSDNRDGYYSAYNATEDLAALEDNAAAAESAESDSYDIDTAQNPLDTSEADASLFGLASLQSFWNEQGTKENIRQAQARTMKKYMDTNVDPCTDFYKFSCGNWERLHPIPKDKAGFDTFEMLRENLDLVLKQLLETSNPVEQQNQLGKVVDIQDNNYVRNVGGTIADIAKDAVASAPEKAITTRSAEQEQLKEKTARLRRHIVNRRDVLSRILRRYRRQQQTTSTKRKRLISLFGFGSSSTRSAEPLNTDDAQIKAKQLYQSCINSQLLQKRGIEPLLQLINSLGGWPVLDPQWTPQGFDWLNLTAQLRRYNNDILIVEWVGPDIKNSDENVIQFDQTSLGLPTREYFLQDMNSRYLQAYQRFMADIMEKLGASPERAANTAAEVILFETQLASITAPAEQRLNVTKLYNRMTLRQLHEAVPEINWLRYLSILQQRNVQDSEQVVIYALDYMQDLVRLLHATEPRTVSNYLLWRFVRHRINNVDDRFEDIKQAFYHTLFGREESPSRWKVCIAQVNTNMGMALGSMFVRKYFDENSKQDTLKMTHELQQAFRDILKTTDWLDASTKHLAELKVNAMSLKIGYPDFILNPEELNEKYAGIAIHPDKYFENTLNVLLHTSKTEQSKLHEPVNKTTWQTAPAIVNAYYSRNKNQIMFPAGILQPPFYHRYFPRSLNFGGIGVVIGHELTHGFDDKGRLFDRNGSIHKWWTDSSIKGFDERARCIIAQYSNYTVGEVGISLNGESTQGENIADNGGIRQAFHAYKRWLQENPAAASDERLPGIDMSGEQLFFLNFGQVWCGAMRPEAVRNKLNTAIHSPGRFRVIGTVSNSPDFAREFKCPLGSPMNPVHKCSVW